MIGTITVIYIYFNGAFYYRSTDTHYKHGKPVAVCYSQQEAHTTLVKLEAKKEVETRK